MRSAGEERPRRLRATAVTLALALSLVTGCGAPSASAGQDVPAPTTGAPSPTRPVRLAVAGDVGTADAVEQATADAMDRLEAEGDFNALVLLGDNIYPDGDVALAGPAVLGPFAPVLDGGTVLYAALGNHDVRTADGEPQLTALRMPGRWYDVRLGPLALIVLDSTRVDDPAQLRWLERTLARTADEAAPWTVVAQHHPPYSAGRHGSHEPSQRLLVPLFVRYGVDLVLAGHDHDYQRSTPQRGVVYLVSGGGGAALRPTGRAGFTAVSASIHHFVELTAHPDRVELRAVDQQGRVFDRLTLAG